MNTLRNLPRVSVGTTLTHEEARRLDELAGDRTRSATVIDALRVYDLVNQHGIELTGPSAFDRPEDRKVPGQG